MREKYTLIERTNVGGMAEIYRALQTSMKGFDKEVAIKKVLPTLTRNRRFISMFLDEARRSFLPNEGPTPDQGRSGQKGKEKAWRQGQP